MQTSSMDDSVAPVHAAGGGAGSAERWEEGRELAGSSRTNSASFRHCSFCLVAEFDIDKGSTLSYQYPAPTGHDEHKLAELMLPDGVHARAEDWTVFFLPVRPSVDEAGDGEKRDGDELVYVLNLVHTKHDNSVRRGALVKAIAIGTRHPFIQIFKPALLLALDDFFESPGMDVLVRLFESLNALDLTAMPRLSRDEKTILRCSERRDLLEERFKIAVKSPDKLGTHNVGVGAADESSARRDEDGTIKTSSTNDTVHHHLRTDSTSSGPTTTTTTTDEVNTKQSNKLAPASGKRPGLNHKTSLASLRLAAGAGLLKRKPSSMTQDNELPRPDHNNSPSHATTPTPMQQASVVRDTHIWDTSISYGKIKELPIRIPTDVFDEEIGEYSLINLINTFGTSTISGPQHAHLHTNGALTSPIILLFNAVVTGKRVIFLGHNHPAHQVAGHVLSLCALTAGSGAGLQGIARRCFPYANLASIDDLERVSGYIAGVTNPRFEDLRVWDVLCNIESGRISVSKDIQPAAPLRPTGGPMHGSTFASTAESGGGAYGSGIGPDGEARLTRAPSESDVLGLGAGSQLTVGRSRDRSGTTTIEAKHDANDNAFMDEILATVAARYSERYVRSRFADYASNFIRMAARHEEYFYGQTTLAAPSQPFLNGQLGSGLLYVDREAETREIMVNARRIEGWRATDSYTSLVAKLARGDASRSLFNFDIQHQLSRLRRAKKIPVSEAELIYVRLVKQLRSPEHVVKLLAGLPAHHGGLLPISSGLFHQSDIVRTAAVEILTCIATHPVGRKMMQSLNVFHRLAFARCLHDHQNAEQQQQADRGVKGDADRIHYLDVSHAATPLGSAPMSLAGSQASVTSYQMAPTYPYSVGGAGIESGESTVRGIGRFDQRTTRTISPMAGAGHIDQDSLNEVTSKVGDVRL